MTRIDIWMKFQVYKAVLMFVFHKRADYELQLQRSLVVSSPKVWRSARHMFSGPVPVE